MSQCEDENRPLGIAIIGNPGVGKSTILNGLCGQTKFKSGISVSRGLTTVLQEELSEDGKISFFDTPGLDDVEMKKQAAMEIDKLLSNEMPLKLAFVVTLEAGRVRASDAATLQIVLQAIKSIDVNNRFGIIINKLSKSESEILKIDENNAKIRNSITGSFQTSHWVHVEKLPYLEDESDQQLLNADLINFFAGLPETKPAKAVVETIDISDMGKKIAEHEARISDIIKANEQQMQQMLTQLEDQRIESNERERKLTEELRKMEKRLHNSQENNDIAKILGGVALSLLTRNPVPLITSALSCVRPGQPEVRDNLLPTNEVGNEGPSGSS